MIHRNSRYRRKETYSSSDPERSEKPLEGACVHESWGLETAREHVVTAGERLDLIAFRYYGDPLKYWLICDAEEAIFPDELVVEGKQIRIPKNRIL